MQTSRLRRNLPLLALLGALLLPAASAPAQEGAGEAAAAPAGEPKVDLDSLRRELEETYLRIQRDFEALTGEKAADRLHALEESVRRSAHAAGEEASSAAEVAAVWVQEKLLGPVVAERLARQVEELLGKGTAIADALRRAVAAVFPEKSMADNWDRQFLDLPVVQRWVEARAAQPEEAGPAPPGPKRVPVAAIPDPADMVLVPKGELAVPANRGRGWPNMDQKADRKTLRAYYIDRFEVTCAAYAAFLREIRDRKLRDRLLPGGWESDEAGMPVVPAGRESLPVTAITYEGASAFADHLGKRLPTEDEWERAARGPDGLLYPWGAEWKEGAAVAGGTTGAPLPVGSRPVDRSPFGAVDMAGNVSEFCATLVDGKPIKGLPRETDQVVRRGGNFREPAADAANDWRYVVGPTARSDLVGFRCAMDERDYERKYGRK